MPKRHAPYPEACRTDAVAFVQRSGKRIAAVAAALGGSGESLRQWVQQAKVNAGAGPPGTLTTEEREALRRLRRETKTLRMERDSVKKAAAFVASETV